MSDKPVRRFWQIHLSTILLLVLSLGLSLGIQIELRSIDVEREWQERKHDLPHDRWTRLIYQFNAASNASGLL
jgi:hypothetical protein